ncbi:hypothetical protein CN354_21815 [Bacillus cereus]|nr:hypothetical protein CN354_21815 [Bacillus cereus]WJE54285.1 hypothetical protein QRE66_08620 [Bacillus cereus]
MFVKVYQYHIQIDKEKEYLEVQEKAASLYQKYIFIRSVYLKSNDDESKWIEMSWYKDEATYKKRIELISHEKELQELWKQFEGIHPEKTEKMEGGFFTNEKNYVVVIIILYLTFYALYTTIRSVKGDIVCLSKTIN